MKPGTQKPTPPSSTCELVGAIVGAQVSVVVGIVFQRDPVFTGPRLCVPQPYPSWSYFRLASGVLSRASRTRCEFPSDVTQPPRRQSCRQDHHDHLEEDRNVAT